ncbi:DUF2182 domain-containing protein [Geodermatophilus sp. CPCC 205761]|uniref:DUF2182 domain-containing protein n=1 Tax=Geodermatophilus sp. CPCC 205761 TaxID=2936597 RepID=UPI003EED0273
MTTASRTAPATRVRHDPAVLLWGVAGACWAGTLALVLRSGIGHGHAPGDAPRPADVALSLAAWTVMVGAMMLPTLVPLARLFAAVSARTPHPWPARAGLYAGYLGAWVAVAPVALAAGWALNRLVGASPWLAARDGLVLGAALLLAGGYQFSRLKDACLTTCRSPASFLWQSYRRGLRGAGRLGLRAGLWCLGCCWALMLLMVATGTGSLAWMLALTAVMVAEKTARRGAPLVRPVGFALLLCGVAVTSSALFAPAAAPCHHGACAAPSVEGMLGPPVG